MNSFDSPLLGLSQRLPPSNLPAEQALLGALLANNKAYERVSEFLAPEHFADPIHGRIFQAIARRCEAGQVADPVMLRAEFEHNGVLEEVGGTAYLAQLAGRHGRHHQCRRLRPAIHDAWIRRQLIDIGEVTVNRAFGSEPELNGACARSKPPNKPCSTWPQRRRRRRPDHLRKSPDHGHRNRRHGA